jgi:3-oxoadipate enol-lactonase
MSASQQTLEICYRGSDGWPLHASVIEPSQTVSGSPLVLLHGGGPDHRMFLPLARELASTRRVILPDIRGYGRSLCADPSRHRWAVYAADVVALLDHLGARRAVIGGAGLGATITLRTAVAFPDRLEAAVLISVEEVEDDEQKTKEIAFMEAFAIRARSEGIEAAWAPILPDLAPLIGTLVREAIPRSDAASIAAAAAIGYDRSFRSVEELAGVEAPVLIFSGMDHRHPPRVSRELAELLPNGRLASVQLDEYVTSAALMANRFAPEIHRFLAAIPSRSAEQDGHS